ncbi:MAG TPA: hypothetical protein VHC69_07720 [Polyangiaceae bacterium]|nr:hypothetical protein [Polyangiaceae bacterium]
MTVDAEALFRRIGFSAIVLALPGCTCSRNDEPKPAAASATAAPAAGSATEVPVVNVPRPPLVASGRPPIDKIIRLPSGPALEILPGQGAGAIRLGATTETIERLMGMPCEIKTATECVYIGRAVEFFLDDKGMTKEIRIDRLDRPAPPEGRTYGVFNGRMANGLTLMMIPKGVESLIGPPQKVEEVTNGGPADTVQIAYYDGLRIEYDKLPPERIVVGGIVVTKGSGKPLSPPAAPHPSAASAKSNSK